MATKRTFGLEIALTGDGIEYTVTKTGMRILVARTGTRKAVTITLKDATVGPLVGDLDSENFRAKLAQAAGEEGIVKKTEAFGEALAAIARRLPEDIRRRATQADAARRGAKEGQHGEELKTKLGGAPIPDRLVEPFLYEVNLDGVWEVQIGEKGEDLPPTQVATAPVVISGRASDIADNTESTKLTFARAGGWRDVVVNRSVVANSREIWRLADQGLPVNSGNAAALVRYLAQFEDSNIGVIPHHETTRQLGWLGEGGKAGFMCGRRLIGSGSGVEFRGADSGEEQIADGFSSAGSLAGWLSTAENLAAFPRVYLAVYGALAPPLLPIISAPNFIVDYSNPTSTGKTTTLRAGASVWGNPDERSPEKMLYSWDATRVWIERAATVLNCLPLILDETKRAKYPKAVSQTLYDVSNGSGRGRGTPRGLARAGSWTTVLLSTGEAPATSFTEDGGTRARTLSLWGSPFGDTGQGTAGLVADLNRGVHQHYGHAGPLLVRHLAENRGEWPGYRELYQEHKRGYLERAKDDGNVMMRLGEYFAALRTTAEIAEDAGAVPAFEDPIDKLWETLRDSAQEADRAKNALEMVMSWAHAHAADFHGRHRTDQDGGPVQPHQGWAGHWEKGDGFKYVGFYPDRLREILRRLDIEYEPTVRAWRDRGWLDVTADRKRNTRTVRMPSGTVRMVAILNEAGS